MVSGPMKAMFSLIPLAFVAFGILFIVKAQGKGKNEKSNNLAAGIPLLISGVLWLIGIIKIPAYI